MLLSDAVLIARLKPTNDGITNPTRAVVRLRDVDVGAIVKELDPPHIAAECFAALLLRSWGLNVPEPILVHDGDKVLFGSLEVDYPSLKQRFNISDGLSKPILDALFDHLSELIKTWEQTPLAIAIDEAIGNKDRNLGNVLWDGGEPSFIDHERCFGLANDEDSNHLAAIASLEGSFISVQQAAIRFCIALLPSFIDKASTDSKGLDTIGYNQYIKSNLHHLPQKVLSRFPQPNDILSQANE